jgi:hypothetical protein
MMTDHLDLTYGDDCHPGRSEEVDRVVRRAREKRRISDSPVAIGVSENDRCSRTPMNHQAMKLAARMKATGRRFCLENSRMLRHQADGPYRGFPSKVDPEEEENAGRRDLPVECCRKTKG